MRKIGIGILAVGFVVLALIGFSKVNQSKVLAQDESNYHDQDNPDNIARRAKFQYAVKFVCGKFVAPTPDPTGENGQLAEGPVKPGNYATAVNIHNPWFRDVFFAKKAVLSLREPDQGKPSQFHRMVLKQDGATEIDCPEIRKILGLNTPEQFIKGYFVVYSTQELDVDPVYTAQSLDVAGNLSGMSIDVEHVNGRKF